MHYVVEIEIDLPRERVFELLVDPDHRSKWQVGLTDAALLEGSPGQVGARSRLVFGEGKRKMEMVEEIIESTPPEKLTCTYAAKQVDNVVAIRLVEVNAGKTRLISENDFKFSGFMRVIGFIAKGAFPRQSRKYLQNFKASAEDGADVNAG